jgi:hypothetical protein
MFHLVLLHFIFRITILFNINVRNIIIIIMIIITMMTIIIINISSSAITVP